MVLGSGTIPDVHFVYIVRCADGTLYTGYARDPSAREQAHNDGRGARYTCGRRPVSLVYSEAFERHGDALRREQRVKRLSRARKEALVASFHAEGQQHVARPQPEPPVA